MVNKGIAEMMMKIAIRILMLILVKVLMTLNKVDQ